jgi:hypothetical protein
MNFREGTAGSMPELTQIEARVRVAAGLPELLSASFDAFELIRLLARRYEDRAPELLPTFMTAADAAVDGREAVTAAPSLTRATRTAAGTGTSAHEADIPEVTDRLAALGALLGERLSGGAALAAATAGDRAACREAGQAARRISSLLARVDHDDDPG